jgi:NitT/TauT family transport system substrate-binding protein
LVAFEPRCSRLKDAGAREVFNSTSIPGEIGDLLLTRKDVVEHRDAALVRLLRGWFATLDHLHSEPQAMAALASAREGITPEMFLQSLRGLQLLDRVSNMQLLTDNREGMKAMLDRTDAIMRAQHLLEHDVDTGSMVTPTIVQRIPR